MNPPRTFMLAMVLFFAVVPAFGQTSRPTTQPVSRDTPKGNDSDPKAIAIADAVMEKLGGERAWEETRFLSWRFFGARLHVWDKQRGDLRVEFTDRQSSEPVVVVMNLRDMTGRAWIGGTEITDAEPLAARLKAAHGMWINDSYWVFMPYKLRDPGVTLRYLGEKETLDGAAADVIELTFDRVGLTPQNKYHVYVGKESGLVEQWDFYRNATDVEPGFQVPWRNWKKYGDILLSDDRGERRGNPIKHTDLAVFDALPREVFEQPEPLDLSKYDAERGKPIDGD